MIGKATRKRKSEENVKTEVKLKKQEQEKTIESLMKKVRQLEEENRQLKQNNNARHQRDKNEKILEERITEVERNHGERLNILEVKVDNLQPFAGI